MSSEAAATNSEARASSEAAAANLEARAWPQRRPSLWAAGELGGGELGREGVGTTVSELVACG